MGHRSGGAGGAARAMSRADLLIGIALGLLLGIVAVILFVFLGSGSTIDAPSLDPESVPQERPEQPTTAP